MRSRRPTLPCPCAPIAATALAIVPSIARGISVSSLSGRLHVARKTAVSLAVARVSEPNVHIESGVK